MMRVTARSASDRSGDWPYWMVWNGCLNVTSEICDVLGVKRKPGQVFTDRYSAEWLAEAFNAWGEAS